MPDSTQERRQSDNPGVQIRLNNVSLNIDNTLLIRNISCNLNSAGKTVVMGPNGAGKSLFLRLIAGLLPPTDGSVDYMPALDFGQDEPAIAMLFQQPVLLRRTTAQNLEYVLRRYNCPKESINQLLDNALKDARLEHRISTAARRLSGGERQRLALARALVVRPRILLLDEVTSSLDPASVHIVEKMLDQASKTGTKILFITHDVRQAKRIADDIIFIHDGQIMAHKSADNFFRDPGSREAQAYLDGRITN